MLATLAIASIAMGPSPSAAVADMAARGRRDRADRIEHVSRTDDGTRSTDSKSDDQPVRADEGGASFIAPASAKPAEVQGGSPTLTSPTPLWLSTAPIHSHVAAQDESIVPSQQFKHTSHQPNAPPIR